MAVTVTVCGVFQFAAVKFNGVGAAVTWVPLSAIDTVAVGWLCSTTV